MMRITSLKKKKEVIVLKDNKWLQLLEMRDPDNGVQGYVYAHEKISDGKVVSMLPYRKKDDKYEFLLREEITPCWGMDPVVSSTTGKMDKEGESARETMIRELKEESGYTIKDKDVIELGTCFSNKASDTVFYLFSVDLTDAEKGKATTDGTELEAMAHNFWVSEGEVKSQDPLVAVMFLRLMKKLLNEKGKNEQNA